jgi:hypothetical protein
LVSDSFLSDGATYKAILDVTGSGGFKDLVKASNFIDQILNHYDDMKQKAPEIAENFRAKTGEKLVSWITKWLTENRAGPVATEKLPDEKTPAIVQLVIKNFIPFDMVVKQAERTGWGPSPLVCENLILQIAEAPNADPAMRAKAQEIIDRKTKKPKTP